MDWIRQNFEGMEINGREICPLGGFVRKMEEIFMGYYDNIAVCKTERELKEEIKKQLRLIAPDIILQIIILPCSIIMQ